MDTAFIPFNVVSIVAVTEVEVGCWDVNCC